MLPIWLLFFTDQLGLGVSLAIALSMSRWISGALFEIPTGSWADRFGRVKTYRIGIFGFALSYLPFLFTDNLYALFATQILGGFFSAMTSGVLSPLVQDSVAGFDNSKKKHRHYLSNSTMAMYVCRLVAGIVGAWLYARYPYSPYLLEAVILLVAFIVSLQLVEIRQEKATATSNREHISEAFRLVVKNRYLTAFFAIVAVYTFVSEAVWTSFQPFFQFREIDPQYFGILFGIVALCSALGAYLSRHFLDKHDPIKVRLWMILGVLLGSICMQIPLTVFVVVVTVVMGLSFGFASPTTNLAIQNHVSSKHQSTVLSFASLSDLAVYAATSLLVGFWADLYGVETLLRVLLIQAAIGVFVVVGIRLWARPTLLSKPTPVRP